jgi:site-specific DNA-methyltransferase (adenine-specific)
MKYTIVNEDVLSALPKMAESSFHACLTDPPYHLTSKGDGSKGFMGQKWDGGNIAFRKETWQAVARVLKPGAFMLAFGGARTFHRLVTAIEDSGAMDIRDLVLWLYADGRPPSFDISKAIDRQKGAEREVIGKYRPPQMKTEWGLRNAKDERTVNTFASSRNNLDITAPATEEAKMFDGYGTALNPSYEPISVSMKPVNGDYVSNALSFGVAGLNINAARIPVPDGEELRGGSGGLMSHIRDGKPYGESNHYAPSALGRWPKNVILDSEAASMLGAQARGAERFFYCPKASTVERNLGLPKGRKNTHPTVKPLQLLRYLCNLIIPPKGKEPRRIVVPFSGSGSEMAAAMLAGFDEVVGIENGGGDKKTAQENIETATLRLAYWEKRMREENGSVFDETI